MSKKVIGILLSVMLLVSAFVPAASAETVFNQVFDDFESYADTAALNARWVIQNSATGYDPNNRLGDTTLALETNSANTQSGNGFRIDVVNNAGWGWLNIGVGSSVSIPAESSAIRLWINNPSASVFAIILQFHNYKYAFNVVPGADFYEIPFSQIKYNFTGSSLADDSVASVDFISIGFDADNGRTLPPTGSIYVDSIEFMRTTTGAMPTDYVAMIDDFDSYADSAALNARWITVNSSTDDYSYHTIGSSAKVLETVSTESGGGLKLDLVRNESWGWLTIGIAETIIIPADAGSIRLWLRNPTSSSYTFRLQLGDYSCIKPVVPGEQAIEISFSEMMYGANSMIYPRPMTAAFLRIGFASDQGAGLILPPAGPIYFDSIGFIAEPVVEVKPSYYCAMYEDFDSYINTAGMTGAGWAVINGETNYGNNMGLSTVELQTGSKSFIENSMVINFINNLGWGWLNVGVDAPVDIPALADGVSFWIKNETDAAYTINFQLGLYHQKATIYPGTCFVELPFTQFIHKDYGTVLSEVKPASVDYLTFGFAEDGQQLMTAPKTGPIYIDHIGFTGTAYSPVTDVIDDFSTYQNNTELNDEWVVRDSSTEYEPSHTIGTSTMELDTVNSEAGNGMMLNFVRNESWGWLNIAKTPEYGITIPGNAEGIRFWVKNISQSAFNVNVQLGDFGKIVTVNPGEWVIEISLDEMMNGQRMPINVSWVEYLILGFSDTGRGENTFPAVGPIYFDSFAFTAPIDFGEYDNSNRTLTNVTPGTDVDTLLAGMNIRDDIDVSLMSGNFALAGTDLVGTGAIINFSFDGKWLSYNVVVYGDVDGDAVIGINDAIAVKRHIIGYSLSGFYLAAADVNHDDKVDPEDITAMKSDILGITDIDQNF